MELEMFHCSKSGPSGVDMPKQSCAKIHQKVQKAGEALEKMNGWGRRARSADISYFRNHQQCFNCKTGAANLKAYPVKIDTKTCPCGKVFRRKPRQGTVSWAKSKYCSEHAEMSPYQRKKALGALEISGNNPSIDQKEKPVVECVKKTSEVFTCKTCRKALSRTSENFRRKARNKGGYDYHCKECRSAMERKASVTRVITVDLTDCPGVYDNLKRIALEEDRPVDMQVRHWLKTEAFLSAV